MARRAKKQTLPGMLGTYRFTEKTPAVPANGIHKPEYLTQDAARERFIQRVLALLGDQDKDLTQEATWEELGQLVVRHWVMFDAQQSSLSTMRMLQECARMKLAIRMAHSKTPDAQDTEILAQYEQLMQDVFHADVDTDDVSETDTDP